MKKQPIKDKKKIPRIISYRIDRGRSAAVSGEYVNVWFRVQKNAKARLQFTGFRVVRNKR